MIMEQATVVSQDGQSLLVETVQQSTCGSCSAQKGCGQGVLAKYLSASHFFRVQFEEDTSMSNYQAGDIVELGIDEFAIVRASLWLYLVPLAGLVFGAFFGSLFSELFSIILALAGLFIGGFLSSLYAKSVQHRPEYAPTLVLDSSRIQVLDLSH